MLFIEIKVLAVSVYSQSSQLGTGPLRRGLVFVAAFVSYLSLYFSMSLSLTLSVFFGEFVYVFLFFVLLLLALTVVACSQSSQLETEALRRGLKAHWSGARAQEVNPFLIKKFLISF